MNYARTFIITIVLGITGTFSGLFFICGSYWRGTVMLIPCLLAAFSLKKMNNE